MNLFAFDPGAVLSFFLTLFRISVVLFLLPFFGGQSIPTTVKGALVIVLSLAVWPRLSFPPDLFPMDPWELPVMLLGEATLGLTMGLMVRFLFAAVQTGGQLIGFQMGFAMVSVMDPDTGVSEAVSAHFLYMTSMLVFLALDGHLFLLKGLAQSFALVPPGRLFLTPVLVRQVLDFSGQMFLLAVKIASPVMASIFLVDLALALISRAAPQMHVLVLGFPVKLGVGFLFLTLIFQLMSMVLSGYVQGMDAMFLHLLRAMGPPGQ